MVVAVKKRSVSSFAELSQSSLETSDLLERIRAASLGNTKSGGSLNNNDSQSSFGSLLTATTAGTGGSRNDSVLPRTRQDLLVDNDDLASRRGRKSTAKAREIEKCSDIDTSEAVLPLFDICQNSKSTSEHPSQSGKDNIIRVPSSLRPSRYGGGSDNTTSPTGTPSSSSSTISQYSGSSTDSSSSAGRNDRICNLRRRIRNHQRRMSTLTDCQSLSRRRSGDDALLSTDDAKSHCSARSAPGRMKGAAAASSMVTTSLPLLPLTTPEPPSSTKHIGSYQSLVTNVLFYTLAATLMAVTALNKYHTSNLAHYLNDARTHTLSAQHHLTTATLELRTYDEYLHSLESIGSSLRSELDTLANNVVSKSRRLTVEDAKVMNEHESLLELLKMKERRRKETMEGLKTRIQEAARTAVVDKYGHGTKNRYHVEVTVQLSSDADQTETFVIETTSLARAPHTVHHFLEQIDAKLWNDRKLAFTSNPGHLLRAAPTSEVVAKEFETKGLDRLIVDESPSASRGSSVSEGNKDDEDEALQPEAYTVAFPTSHSSSKPTNEVGFYINTSDNTDGLHDDDAIIGTVISGREVISRIMALPASATLIDDGGVKIVGAKIL